MPYRRNSIPPIGSERAAAKKAQEQMWKSMEIETEKIHNTIEYSSWTHVKYFKMHPSSLAANDLGEGVEGCQGVVHMMAQDFSSRLNREGFMLMGMLTPITMQIVKVGSFCIRVTVTFPNIGIVKELCIQTVIVEGGFYNENTNVHREWTMHMNQDSEKAEFVYICSMFDPFKKMIMENEFFGRIRVKIEQELDSERVARYLTIYNPYLYSHEEVCLISVESRGFMCNRNLLVENSPVFASLLGPGAGVTLYQLKLLHVQGHELESVIQFLYHGDILSAYENLEFAIRLLEISVIYFIPLLRNKMLGLLYRIPESTFGINKLVLIVELPKARELLGIRRKAIRLLNNKPKPELMSSSELASLFLTRPDLAYEIFILGAPYPVPTKFMKFLGIDGWSVADGCSLENP